MSLHNIVFYYKPTMKLLIIKQCYNKFSSFLLKQHNLHIGTDNILLVSPRKKIYLAKVIGFQCLI